MYKAWIRFGSMGACVPGAVAIWGWRLRVVGPDYV